MNSSLNPKIIFRTDASLEIGTGHVMRCLTLANALKERGIVSKFVCRNHPGNLLDLIRSGGFEAYALPLNPSELPAVDGNQSDGLAHEHWLGASWATDAKQTLDVINDDEVDWLIVDHYALDMRWENRLRSACKQLMVIDDLADRSHNCDLLLDQNLGRESDDYMGLVPALAIILTGPGYALLRPEFALLREYSLSRRISPHLNHLLISMGGVDLDNTTGCVLETLKHCSLPEGCSINVVMGANAPWLEQIRVVAKKMPWPTKVLVNVSEMAKLIAESDLAIGAAGSTSWERCCLGVPTILFSLAKNQESNCAVLAEAGAAISLKIQKYNGDHKFCGKEMKAALNHIEVQAMKMIEVSTNICDGLGCNRVINIFIGGYK